MADTTSDRSATDPRQQRGLRTFYTLAVAQIVSQIGSQMSSLAVGIYVYQQTGQATPLTLVALFLMLPTVLAGSIAGVLADRLDRRLLMIVGDTGAALGTVALFISISTGAFQIWHLYVVALWQSLFGVFQRPAFTASITLLVPDDQRQRANAIMQMGGPAAGLIAPALTGVLYAVIGLTGVIAIDLATFLFAVSVTLLVRIPRPKRTEHGEATRGSMLRELGGAFRFVRERRPLFIHILQVTLLNFLIGSCFALLTPYLLARTGSEATMGLLLTVLNVGGIVGAIAIGAWGGFKRRIDTIMISCIIALIAVFGFGMAQTPLMLGVMLFVVMAGITILNASFFTFMQSKIPGDMQGRVFALLDQIGVGLTPIGYLLVGPLADQILEPLAASESWGALGGLFGTETGAGMGLMFSVSAGLSLLVTLVVYALPSVRRMEATMPDYASSAVVTGEVAAASAEPAVVPVAD